MPCEIIRSTPPARPGEQLFETPPLATGLRALYTPEIMATRGATALGAPSYQIDRGQVIHSGRLGEETAGGNSSAPLQGIA